MMSPQQTLATAADALARSMRQRGMCGSEEMIVREIAALAYGMSTRAVDALLPHVESRARELGCHAELVGAALGMSDVEHGEGSFEMPVNIYPGMGE